MEHKKEFNKSSGAEERKTYMLKVSQEFQLVGRRESLRAQAKAGCLNHLSKEQKENEERTARAHRSYG